MASTTGGIDYRPLDPSKNEIRLLRIHYEDEHEGSRIHSSLLTVSLHENPFYQALSYCWGDPSITSAILLDGEQISVTVNLVAALQELRRREVRTIWADAVCINQSDEVEKGHQVANMGSIYSRAASVFAWLGSAADGSDMVMEQFESASHKLEQERNARTTRRARKEDSRKREIALEMLLARPYWSRAWILQEIAKARNVVVLCGSKSVHWDSMMKVLPSAPEAVLALQRFRESARDKHNASSLLDALMRTTHLQASDKRDRVYSLLPVVWDAHHFPSPTYMASPASVFAGTCRTMIMMGNLTALYLSRYCQPPAGWNEILPSWATNWASLKADLPPWISPSVRNQLPRVPTTIFQSDDSSLRLICFGSTVIDAVAVDLETSRLNFTHSDRDAWTAQVQKQRNIHDPQTSCRKAVRRAKLRRKTALEDLWRSIVHWSDELRPSTPVSDDDVLEGFEAHFVLKPDAFDNPWVPHSLLNYMSQWLNANKDFQSGRSQETVQFLAEQERSYHHEVGACAGHNAMVCLAILDMVLGLKLLSRYRLRVAALEEGRICVVPNGSQAGDQICWLAGSALPVVLRPVPSRDDTYRYVGELDEGEICGQLHPSLTNPGNSEQNVQGHLVTII